MELGTWNRKPEIKIFPKFWNSDFTLRLAHYFFVSKKVAQKTAVDLKNSATLSFPH
jgi:hypothetical protein